MEYHIAIDIGASSGRLVLGKLQQGKLTLQEIHRFKNGFTWRAGHDRWDLDYLLQEIVTGLAIAKRDYGVEKTTVGIDTWAVDYVLVDRTGQRLEEPISYRDPRTKNSIETMTRHYSKDYIYQKTGIQFQNFNTLYQLYEEDATLLKQTQHIMLIPDYIGYWLTGKAVTEVTNASTTQMLNLREGLFDQELLESVNITAAKFPELVEAGTVLGPLKESLRSDARLPICQVMTVATHDTASAVVGTPAKGQHWAFLSSGTWSLLGRELNVPENGQAAFEGNYTNEWGAYGTYRFLKNIMGLWMVQCLRKETTTTYSFAEMAALAEQVKPFQQFIDINAERFVNPKNMTAEIQAYCRETKQVVPQTLGELVSAVYCNLALYYACEIRQLQEITKEPLETLNIVGGGSNVHYLNQLTSDLAQIKVEAGPGEATAVGNIAVQMITAGELSDLAAARQLVSESFEIKRYEPQQRLDSTVTAYQRFLEGQDDAKNSTDHVLEG